MLNVSMPYVLQCPMYAFFVTKTYWKDVNNKKVAHKNEKIKNNTVES